MKNRFGSGIRYQITFSYQSGQASVQIQLYRKTFASLAKLSRDSKALCTCPLQHQILHDYRIFQHFCHMMGFKSINIVLEVVKYDSPDLIRGGMSRERIVEVSKEEIHTCNIVTILQSCIITMEDWRIMTMLCISSLLKKKSNPRTVLGLRRKPQNVLGSTARPCMVMITNIIRSTRSIMNCDYFVLPTNTASSDCSIIFGH